MDTLIVGLGNRFFARDALGCLVHDWLARHPLPPGVTLLDGGLAGLDLLGSIEQARRVIFADALIGEEHPPGRVQRLSGPEVAARATHFGHSAGLPYLLAVLPLVSPPPLPDCRVVGAAGHPTPALVKAVAQACLEEVSHRGQS